MVEGKLILLYFKSSIKHRYIYLFKYEYEDKRDKHICNGCCPSTLATKRKGSLPFSLQLLS